jgi:hypothetical protein
MSEYVFTTLKLFKRVVDFVLFFHFFQKNIVNKITDEKLITK